MVMRTTIEHRLLTNVRFMIFLGDFRPWDRILFEGINMASKLVV